MNVKIASALVVTFLACVGVYLEALSDYGLTYSGHIALAMVFIAAILWLSEAVPLFVTSLIVLFLAQAWLYPALTTQGLELRSDIFYAAFASDVIFLFLGGFTLSSAFHAYALDRWIVSKTLGGKTMPFPYLILYLMILTTWLSFWLSNTATTAMMLGLVMPVVIRLSPDDPGRKSLILSIPFAANVGGLATPISGPPNAIAMEYMRQQGLEHGFLQWIIMALPGVIALLIVGWLLLLFLFPAREKIITLDDEAIKLQQGWKIPLIMVIAMLTVLGWVSAPFHGLSNGMVAMLPFVSFFGLGLLSKRHLFGLSWDVLLLMGGGLCLGTVVKESGLAEWVISLLPMHQMSFYKFMLAIVIGGALISSVMSNTAAANLILPIVVMLDVEDPKLLTLAVTFTCAMAIPLPISTPPNAMAFSTGEISVRDMAKAGTLMTVISVALTVTLGYAYWLFLERFY